MTGHARLGPSNHRWPNCPGSVREEKNYEDIPGAAAIDGTGSHLLLEMCLENNVPAVQYDRQIIGTNHPDNPGGWLVGPDRIERVQMCLDYVTRRVNELEAEFEGSKVTIAAESKSNPGGFYLRDDWWGTVDITLTCIDSEGVVVFMEVIDYKDGRGYVHARDNSQLIAYLAGKMRPYIGSGPELVRPFHTEKIRNCRMTIVQPKTNPVVRYQCSTKAADKMSAITVMDDLDKLSDAAAATDKPNAPTRSGKHCQWCKANPRRGGHCVTATEEAIEVVTNMSNKEVAVSLPMFEQIQQLIVSPADLTSEQLSELMSTEDAFMAAYDAGKKEIQRRIEAGEHVSGYAMEPGRISHRWNDSDKNIEKKLKARKLTLADIYPKKLVSVAALLKCEKLTDAQRKTISDTMVSDVAGKLTLKKVAHKVAQCTTTDVQSLEQMFMDVPLPSENNDISFL